LKPKSPARDENKRYKCEKREEKTNEEKNCRIKVDKILNI
jgi:hypothetical protein